MLYFEMIKSKDAVIHVGAFRIRSRSLFFLSSKEIIKMDLSFFKEGLFLTQL